MPPPAIQMTWIYLFFYCWVRVQILLPKTHPYEKLFFTALPKAAGYVTCWFLIDDYKKRSYFFIHIFILNGAHITFSLSFIVVLCTNNLGQKEKKCSQQVNRWPIFVLVKKKSNQIDHLLRIVDEERNEKKKKIKSSMRHHHESSEWGKKIKEINCHNDTKTEKCQIDFIWLLKHSRFNLVLYFFLSFFLSHYLFIYFLLARLLALCIYCRV